MTRRRHDGLSRRQKAILAALAEFGPLRATTLRSEAYDWSRPASDDDEDRSPWLALTPTRSLIGLGLVRYVRETDRYALTSAGYRILPPTE